MKKISTVWLITKKDFLLNLISARFVIGFVLCLVVIPFTLIVGIDSYKSRMRVYQVFEKEVENAPKDIQVYSQIRPEFVIPPEPLSIFSRGISDNIGNRVKIQLGEYPLFPSGHSAARDNPLLNAFFSIDFATVIAILISLLALVFSYDIFTREREDGTLKASLANAVNRATFLTGKLLGIFLTLIPILLFCFLLSTLVVTLSPAIQFSAGEWGGVALLFISSMLYMAVFVLLGMFISAKSRRSSTSIVICLLCWIWFLFLTPSIASYLSQSFVKTEMYENVQFALRDLDNQFDKENEEKRKALTLEINPQFSYRNTKTSNDGQELILVCDRELYEFHRALNNWKEPARIDYADKKWAIQKNYLDNLIHQEKVREYISWLSPAGIFEQIAEQQSHTGQASFLRYMNHIRVYRESLIRYFKDRKLFDSFKYFTPIPESVFLDTGWNQKWRTAQNDPPEFRYEFYPSLNLDDVPVFEYKGETVVYAMNASLGRMAGMLALCIILLGATALSFIKYDVR